MKTLIIAAGEGTRLRPLTDTRPKPMIPILGKPMLEHVILQLARLDFKDIIIVVGYRRKQIESYFRDGEKFGASIKYVTQEKPEGEAHAILLAEDYLKDEERFLMVDGDFLADDEMIRQTWNIAWKKEADVTLALTKVDNPSQFGIVDIKEDATIQKIIEKPSPGTEPSDLGVSSIYTFSPTIFDYLKKKNDLEKAIQDIIDFSGAVIGAPYTGFWMDIGRPWDVLRATDYLLQKETKNGSRISDSANIHREAEIIDPVIIGSDVQIMKGAVVKGPVYIGSDTMIGNNSLIRNGTSLGKHVEIGYSNEVTHSILFDGAIVSHLVYCGDSIIGQGSHLGAGTTTANVRFDNKTISVTIKGEKFDSNMNKLGVIMGDYSHTGVNVSIYPGRIIGSNCRIGPSVVVREDIPRDSLVQLATKTSLEITKLPPLAD
ncbi:MAG: bifunctional sugar-1-phosphate nucleotidylyltransferase/acetyltransferase [Candidatus Ranarchaeia archaeon]